MPPVEIQWCDHSSVLLEYLRQLYEEGRFVDVGLECEGRQVKAHKAVISACSPYLEVSTGVLLFSLNYFFFRVRFTLLLMFFNRRCGFTISGYVYFLESTCVKLKTY